MRGWPGQAFAAAIHAVLSHERERIGQQIERDGETSARRPHHRFVALERVAVLVEDGCFHFLGFDGRSSTRLGRLRGSCCSRLTTTSATSSGAIFQSAPFEGSPPPNPVATDPGIT